MAALLRITAAVCVAVSSGCSSWSAWTQQAPQGVTGACGERVVAMMSSSDRDIRRHDFARASRTAESAANVSLQCKDRWRAANALKVAAELAHQNGDAVRAGTLLHRSFALMRGLHQTKAWSDVTQALLAERLDSTRREMNGQWVYW